MAESATVSIRRTEQHAAMIGELAVNIDGEQVGMLRNSEEKFFDVKPGEHSVKLQGPRLVSNPMTLSLGTGEMAKLDCKVMEMGSHMINTIGIALLVVVAGLLYWLVELSLAIAVIVGVVLAFRGYEFLMKKGGVPSTTKYKVELRSREDD